MHQTFKGFFYDSLRKLGGFREKVKRFFSYDSIVLSQEQVVAINSICGKTKHVQYLSILQNPKNKVIGLCVQGLTPEGNTFITDNIPIDINGNILLGGNGEATH